MVYLSVFMLSFSNHNMDDIMNIETLTDVISRCKHVFYVKHSYSIKL